MSKQNIVAPAFGAILFIAVIIGFIISRIDSSDEVKLLVDTIPIKKVNMTIITSPNFDGKKQVVIPERDLLDSLNTAFRYNSKPLDTTIAKDNDVYVLLDVYKGNSKASLKVVNSKYTGWVLKVGDYNFTNDYVFKFVQRYL
jgi:hypothetical protein